MYIRNTATTEHGRLTILFGVLSAICLLCSAETSHAILIGTQVTGTVKFGSDPVNYFDPAKGYVPTGYLNLSSPTVTISGTQTEFGYLDGAGPLSVEFTDTTLKLTETLNVVGNYLPQLFTFNDLAFGPLNFSLLSSSFPGGLTSSKSSTAIALAWAGTSVTSPATYSATYLFSPPSPVPEPSTWIIGAALLISLTTTSFLRWKNGSAGCRR